MQRRLTHSNQDGFALFSAFLLLILLMILGSTSLFVSSLNLQSASHYRTGHQAFFAAESGLMHALSTMNARGAQDFQADIAATEQWSRLYGAALKTMTNGASYQVSVLADPGNPRNAGQITGIGFAPLEARRILRLLIRKSTRADQGALYLAADNVAADFGARDQFEIDGNDHHMDLSLNPAGPLRPGISTRNDDVTQSVKDVLSTPQKEKVKGLGFSLSPLNPSVMTTEGPTVTDLEQIIARILTENPVVEVGDAVLPSGSYGTPEAPQVTHLTNDRVRLDGTMTGAGILIADGEFTINGSANFIGWMIIRGDTILESRVVDDTLVDGNATIVGSLWTGDLVVHVGGSAIVDFCTECMALADGTGNGDNVPKVMSILSWQEVL